MAYTKQQVVLELIDEHARAIEDHAKALYALQVKLNEYDAKAIKAFYDDQGDVPNIYARSWRELSREEQNKWRSLSAE